MKLEFELRSLCPEPMPSTLTDHEQSYGSQAMWTLG